MARLQITRLDLVQLWECMTGDALVSIKLADPSAPYWGQVWTPCPGFSIVELRADLIAQPQEFVRTYCHELAHRLRGDSERRPMPPGKPLAQLVALHLDRAQREAATVDATETLMAAFVERLRAAGCTSWRDVIISL